MANSHDRSRSPVSRIGRQRTKLVPSRRGRRLGADQRGRHVCETRAGLQRLCRIHARCRLRRSCQVQPQACLRRRQVAPIERPTTFSAELWSTAIVAAAGTASCNSSSFFSSSSVLKLLTPVRLRPGRFRLSTSPDATGSPADMNTIGIAADCCLRGAGRVRASGRRDDGHPTTNEVGRYRRNSVVLSLCPAIFDDDIPAFDEAGFAQALTESLHVRRGNLSAEPPLRNPITGSAGCCACAAIGRKIGEAAAPPSSVMNCRRFIRSPRRRWRAA